MSQSLDGGLTWHGSRDRSIPIRASTTTSPLSTRARARATVSASATTEASGFRREHHARGRLCPDARARPPGTGGATSCSPGSETGTPITCWRAAPERRRPYDFKVLSPRVPAAGRNPVRLQRRLQRITINRGAEAHPIWSDTRNANPYPANGVRPRRRRLHRQGWAAQAATPGRRQGGSGAPERAGPSSHELVRRTGDGGRVSGPPFRRRSLIGRGDSFLYAQARRRPQLSRHRRVLSAEIRCRVSAQRWAGPGEPVRPRPLGRIAVRARRSVIGNASPSANPGGKTERSTTCPLGDLTRCLTEPPESRPRRGRGLGSLAGQIAPAEATARAEPPGAAPAQGRLAGRERRDGRRDRPSRRWLPRPPEGRGRGRLARAPAWRTLRAPPAARRWCSSWAARARSWRRRSGG